MLVATIGYYKHKICYIYISLSYDVASGSKITSSKKNRYTTSGLQIYGKRYGVHNNVAYRMTKL